MISTFNDSTMKHHATRRAILAGSMLVIMGISAGSSAFAQIPVPPAPPQAPVPERSIFLGGSEWGLIANARFPCAFLGIQGSDAAGGEFRREPVRTEPVRTRGAFVDEVITGTGAEEAGLQVKDVIRSYNGEPVSGIFSLRRLVLDTEPGTTVQLEVEREGTTRTVSAVIGDRSNGGPCPTMQIPVGTFPEIDMERFELSFDSLRAHLGTMNFPQGVPSFRFFGSDTVRFHSDSSVFLFFGRRDGLADELQMLDSCRSRRIFSSGMDTNFRSLFRRLDLSDRRRLGIALQSIPDQLAEYFQVPAGEHGVLVSEVFAGGRAEEAGFRAGDVIIEVNGHSVSGPADVVRAQSDGLEADTFMIVRDGRVHQLSLERRLDEMPEEDID